MLHTDRTTLRQWLPSDREPFARLNADPEVMRFFPAPLERAESDALADEFERNIEREGFGLWAVDLEDVGFIGFVGLKQVPAQLPAAPAIEIGWRLARAHWGKGLAPEAAQASVKYGFDELDLPEIVAFTAEINHPSRRVMEKIGMTHEPERDFKHPLVPGDSPLLHHVLYAITP